MAMNPMLAAGLFDSPWVVAAIVIIGAFINWLSQLRQQKKQRDEEKRAHGAAPDSSQKPKGDFDVEEALRRLLGEEAPDPAPVPPPIPRAAAPPPPPPPTVWQGRMTPPVIVLPPIAVALPAANALELAGVDKQVARLARASDRVRQHQVQKERERRVGTTKWSGLWRDRASVRRAFVGSLVFGPPKGLES
jgi:hypothetical protein